MTETQLILYCDFHGHSRKQNVFIYGCENKHLPSERLKERIFPAMLSKNDPTKVRFSLLLSLDVLCFYFSSPFRLVNTKYRRIKKEQEEW